MNMHVEQTSYIGNVKYSDCFKNLLELILPEVCIIKKFSCSELAFHFKVKLFFERLEIRRMDDRLQPEAGTGLEEGHRRGTGRKASAYQATNHTHRHTRTSENRGAHRYGKISARDDAA